MGLTYIYDLINLDVWEYLEFILLHDHKVKKNYIRCIFYDILNAIPPL